MAGIKEMNIVFVYDRERCTTEADDPISAVAYFHPSWVSDVHRLTLCGQLMGVSHFLDLNFSEGRTIVLQSGKFMLTSFGRFILVVGTDRNISDAALSFRSELLAAVVRLYHRSLETVYEQCMANSSHYKTVTDKFYHIFETYLPLLQQQSSVFNSVPTLKMPQSANCVFVEAIQTLQDCRQLRGVIGGTVLYHNKIVSTQLPAQVSKMFVLTDPYRIKTTASQLTVPYHVPVGCQLIVVYMPLGEYQKLKNHAQRTFNLQNSSVQNGGILPFQLKRKAKRDKSLLFSNIPEEEALNGFSESQELQAPGGKRNGISKPRPTHLPLRLKNDTAPESGFNSINFDETDSFPDFIGKTSVCSTPRVENKILPSESVLPLCANQVIQEQEEDSLSPREEVAEKEIKLVPENFPAKTFDHFRGNAFRSVTRSVSGCHLSTTAEEENSIPMKDLLALPKGKQKFQTITDPSYPVFNDDGMPISRYMYDLCGVEVGLDIAQDVESLKIEGFGADGEMMENGEREREKEKLPLDGSTRVDEVNPSKQANGIHPESPPPPPIDEIIFRNKPKDPSTEEKRRSLTLPIQPINLDPPEGFAGRSPGEDDELGDTFPDKPMKRKRADFPVTPIMSKIISQLNFDSNWSSGFSSCTLTPVMTPIDSGKAFIRRRSSITKVDEVNEDEEELLASGELQKVELFVCGQHNMTMLVVMEENSGQREELVQSLWETCISRLPKIETNLQQTLNVNVDGVVDKHDMNYSFMVLDPNWDVIQQGGHWTAEEMQTVEEIHLDFKENGSFTENLTRCHDSVIYGYRCGDTEVYYKQPATQLRGIPQPADGMGSAPLNAKRRLERDHSIILL